MISKRSCCSLFLFTVFFAASGLAQESVVSDPLQEEALPVVAPAGEAPKTTQQRLDELDAAYKSERAVLTAEVLNSFSAEVEIYDGRAYKAAGKKFPWQLKCTDADYRTFHGCLELRFFDPSARVYFDTGSDDEGEVDLFNDGKLNISVDLVSIYVPWRLGKSSFYDKWSWGPVIGAGLGAPAKDSEDGSVEASGAPVVLFSLGGMMQYRLESGPSFSFEAGYSRGFTSDESVDDSDDSASYVGIRINVPIGEKDSPKTSKDGT